MTDLGRRGGAPRAPEIDRAGEPLRWGILGATSTVARLAVIPAMLASPAAELVAVASLSGAGAWPGPQVYRSYDALLDDAEVEAVYLPLPNHLHRIWTERAAAAGKQVLCEKPLAPSALDGEAMALACRNAGVVLAEAYMTPFHPRSRVMVEDIRAGCLGDLRSARCGFTFPLRDSANHRWDPACGGGALLDVGVYCLAPLLDMAGRQPAHVSAVAHPAPTGVDASFDALLDFGDGFTAHIWCSFELPEGQTMTVAGTEGAIHVDRAFTPGVSETSFTVTDLDGGSRQTSTAGVDPYRAMIEQFQRVVRHGRAPLRPPETSIAVLSLIDRLRNVATTGPDR